MSHIKTVKIQRFNYLLPMPDDFVKPLAVYREGWMWVEEQEALLKRHGLTILDKVPTNDECYFVQDRIGDVGLLDMALTGSYSKWWVVRKLEQLIDIIFPVTYKITYYTK